MYYSMDLQKSLKKLQNASLIEQKGTRKIMKRGVNNE